MKKASLVGIVLAVGVALGVLASVLGYWFIVPRMAYLPGGGRCLDCHQMHGAIEIDELTTDGLIWLGGDVNEPVWIEVHEMFQAHREAGLASMAIVEGLLEDHRELPGIRLLDLLAEYGNVRDFERVVLVSIDGGHVAIERESVSDTARLVPWLNSVRFADERLHSSAWFRGIYQVIVVGVEPTLTIDGESTSIGALLAADGLRTVVTEPGAAMLLDQDSGQLYRNVTSRTFIGADVLRLCGRDFGGIEIVAGGERYSYPAEEVLDAVLAHGEDTPTVSLVLPGQSRGRWLFDVTELVCLP